MTDYKITDEKRKMLTEKLLGECWHEEEPHWWCNYCQSEKSPVQVTYAEHCTLCGEEVVWRAYNNRTFTTDTDMLAVSRAIMDKGKLQDFINYVCYCLEVTIPRQPVYFMRWLFLDNPERACCLAADFLEEQG